MPSALTLLKQFTTGQGGGIGTYTAYASDHDLNYVAIENWAAQVKSQLDAISGSASSLVFDLLQSTSPLVTQGRIGDHSYKASLITADTQVQITAGRYLFGGDGLTLAATATFTGSGIAGARYIALQADGSVTQETAASQGVLDIYELSWLGAIFDTGFGVGGIQDNTSVMPDGDDLQDMLTVVGNASAGPPSQTHAKIADRLENLDRILQGLRTNVVSGATALGPIAIPGSAAAAGLCLGDGTTFETDTGLYRAGVDRIAATTGGVQSLEIDAAGNLDLPLNSRVATTLSAGTATGGTPLNLAMDTELFDVGAWHSGTSADHTVPTDGAGIYAVSGEATFQESTAASGGTANAGNFRSVQIIVNGAATDLPTGRVAPAGAGDTILTASGLVSLAVSDVVRLQVDHDNGGTMSVGGHLAVVKVA